MDLRQLEAFAAVMSAGSITGAAQLLGRSQPVVTRLIQDLEAGLGFELLHRRGPRVTPTERGMLFHEEVDRLLGGLRHLGERAEAIARQEPRAVDIMAIPTLALGLVPMAIARVSARDLPRRIHLRSGSAEQVALSLTARTADIGFASLPVEHLGLDVHWIGEAPWVVALAEGDPLAAANTVPLAALAGRRIVTMANPHRWRRRIDAALAAADVKPRAIVDTNASITAVFAARAGLGVAFVDPVTAYGAPVAGVAIRPVDTPIPYFWQVVTPAGRPPTPTVAALIAEAAAVAEATLPGFVRRDASERAAISAALYDGLPDLPADEDEEKAS